MADGEKRLTLYNKKDQRTITRPERQALMLAAYPEWEVIGSEAEQYATVVEPPKKKEVVEPVEEVKIIQEPEQVVETEQGQESEEITHVQETEVNEREALNLKYKALFGRMPSPRWGDEAVKKRITDKENE